MTRRDGIAWGVAGVVALGVAVLVATRRADEVSCGAGFSPQGPRCCPGVPGETPFVGDGTCGPPSGGCPPPLIFVAGTCDAPVSRVDVPETTVEVGASDWEAEGKVASRVVHVNAFRIDAFEATTHAVYGAGSDGARAAAGLSRDEAAEFCARRGGRLPTDDEWLVAAAGGGATRYPWGDTGAVCRRAAWGLAKGPCSDRGQGPDTVGAHPDGDSALGLHDMAGNVAEWVAPRHAAEAAGPAQGVARGGTWASPLAADLRVWSRIVLPADAHDPRVGVRCAYDAPP